MSDLNRWRSCPILKTVFSMRRLYLKMRKYLAEAIAVCAVIAAAILSPSTANASQLRFSANLSPANEVPAVMTEGSASGNVIITLNVTTDYYGMTTASAQFYVDLSNFPTNHNVVLAHIHQAAAGMNGPVVCDTGLSTMSPISLTTGGATISRAGLTISPDLAQAIMANPSQFYFNVHTDANISGAVRGQLAPADSTTSTVELDATLLPANEVPPVTGADAAITGTAKAVLTLERDPGGTVLSASAVLSFTLSNVPASETIILAHIHTGAAGTSGGVLIDSGLSPGSALTPASGAVTFTSSPISVSPANAQSVIGNPAGFYFNVHSSANTGGAARGQLVNPAQTTASTATFAARLLPANEVPPVTNGDASITGDVLVIITLNKDAGGTIQSASTEFDYTLSGVPATDMIILSHVHNAAAGANGPVRIDSGITPATALTPTNGTVTFSKS